MTEYFVDTNGNYLGGFDGAKPPSGALEIPNPPEHGWDKWINGAWVPNKDRLNAPIKAQIAALEVITHRKLSDLVMGDGDLVSGPDNKTPRQRLAEIRAQMDALRAQLKP